MSYSYHYWRKANLLPDKKYDSEQNIQVPIFCQSKYSRIWSMQILITKFSDTTQTGHKYFIKPARILFFDVVLHRVQNWLQLGQHTVSLRRLKIPDLRPLKIRHKHTPYEHRLKHFKAFSKNKHLLWDHTPYIEILICHNKKRTDLSEINYG